MNPLRTFYNNDVMREAVKVFLIEVLKEMAIERAFGGESVVGVPEAKELVEKAFDKLDEMFKAKEKVEEINSR